MYRLGATILATACLFSMSLAVGLASSPRPNIGLGQSNMVARRGPGTLPTSDLNAASATDLVNSLLGAGVSVSNVSFSGINSAAGTFSGGTGIVGFESGIVLSSGNIASISGPTNVQDDTTTSNGQPGDSDLDALIPGFQTFDRAVLEFDFECAIGGTIQFQYIFASEEYNEFVFDDFNDVFGFFLNGVNIALVPGAGSTPVAINNVNCGNPFDAPAGGSNCFLYRNNDCGDLGGGSFPCSNIATEMDGLTVVFTATGALNPGTNHIKLAIADAGDDILDSNVLIQSGSLSCELPTGACCDTGISTCRNDVIEADCQGLSEIWNVGLACDQLDPPCVEEPDGIPALSQWGLTALVLVLLVAAKVSFRRRSPA